MTTVYVRVSMLIPCPVNEADPAEAEAYVQQLIDDGELENIYDTEITGTFDEDMTTGFGFYEIASELTTTD